jgi:hypothetical protein
MATAIVLSRKFGTRNASVAASDSHEFADFPALAHWKLTHVVPPDRLDVGMRLVSTPESVKRGEVSMLAIVETLVAIGLVFFLSAHFNTLRWLGFAACVAPLLLLRTEASTKFGIEWIDRWFDRWVTPVLQKNQGKVAFFRLVVLFLGFFLTGTAIRIAATFWGTVTAPMLALQAIPKNWARVILAMDSCFAPEFIPEHPQIKLPQDFQGATWTDILVGTPLLALLFLPALFYRWSLKATSIIYAPLVFVVHTTFRRVPDLRTKLKLIKHSDMTLILALYAVCYVAAFLVKLVLMLNLPSFAEWWNGTPVRQFAALYVAPSEIPKWQLASLTNCAAALGTWLFARQALLRIEVGRPWHEGAVQRTLGFATGLRTVLALYTIACTGYLTLRAARGWHWPALGEKWLPWQ